MILVFIKGRPPQLQLRILLPRACRGVVAISEL